MVQVLGKECGSTGYGLMSFHSPPNPPTFEVAISTMKRALSLGCNLWSAALFYGNPENNSLHLLNAYFSQYPDDAERVVLVLKVGLSSGTMKLRTTEPEIRADLAECERILDGKKKIDVLSCARVDPQIGVEEAIGTLAKLVQEGRIGGVGMSECGADTLRRASQITKIVAVEVEFSLFTPDILSNGVAQAANEAGALIIAYSPLGKGMLTGTVKQETLAADDPRRRFPRFQADAMAQNLKMVQEVNAIAERVGGTKSQVALAWVRKHSGQEGRPWILPIPGTKSVERLEENVKEVELGVGDMRELDEIIKQNPIEGGHCQPPGRALKFLG